MARPRKIKPQDSVAEVKTSPSSSPAEVEVVIMCANMWWDDVKHMKRARIKMPRVDAEEICARDVREGRDERLLIL